MPITRHPRTVYPGAAVNDRYDPQLLAYFEDHRQRWLRGEVRLRDWLEDKYVDEDGERPLWYARPLGLRKMFDKAQFFDLVGYRPSEPACQAHASTAKVRVFSGGARAGKSKWGGMELCPILLTPGTQSWIVGPKYASAEKEFEYVRQSTIYHPALRDKLKPQIAVNTCRPDQGDMRVELDWGPGLPRSWVRVKSAVDADSLLSEELDAVLICEASQIPEDRWHRYLKMRLATREGIAMIPTSPHGMGWVAELYRKGIDGEPGHFAINVDSRMNPTLSPEEVEFWTQDMSDEDFEEQVRGRPAPKSGRVYAGFDRAIHVEPWQSDWPKPTWKRYRGIDFGYTDPFVVLWFAEDEDRRLYVYREFYKTKHLVDDVARHIARVEQWDTDQDPETTHIRLCGDSGRRERISVTVADWDASDRAALQRAGIRTRKAVKDMQLGIKTVQELLRIRGDGRPRLYVHPSCKHTIREFDVYEWDRKSETPKGKDDHAMDVIRYVAHTLQPARRDMTIRSLSV